LRTTACDRRELAPPVFGVAREVGEVQKANHGRQDVPNLTGASGSSGDNHLQTSSTNAAVTVALRAPNLPRAR
jgi:hypothetical protein